LTRCAHCSFAVTWFDIPFIITGSISEEVAVECMKQGADYLLKDRLVRHAVQQKNYTTRSGKLSQPFKKVKSARRPADNAHTSFTAIGLPALEALNMLALQQRLSPATTKSFMPILNWALRLHVDDRRRVLQQSIAGEDRPSRSALIAKTVQLSGQNIATLPSTTRPD